MFNSTEKMKFEISISAKIFTSFVLLFPVFVTTSPDSEERILLGFNPSPIFTKESTDKLQNWADFLLAAEVRVKLKYIRLITAHFKTTELNCKTCKLGSDNARGRNIYKERKKGFPYDKTLFGVEVTDHIVIWVYIFTKYSEEVH